MTRNTASSCPLCGKTGGIKHVCEVCHSQNCRSCCKRYLALAESPARQVRTCNDCFLEHVAWDSKRTYDVFGPASGKVVVLVHGALVGRQCLVQEARALADAGFRVVVPDLPAHGSRFKEHPLTLDNAVATLYECIQQEAKGQKVVMMGFSMGGYVTAAFAAVHPDVLAGVLLGACCHDAHTTTWRMVGKMAEAVYAVCSYKAKSQFMYKSYPEVMSPNRPEIQEAFLRAGAEFDAWKYTWRVMYDADMHKLLPKITCPALLVVGEQDFRSHEQKWLSLLPKGSLLVLKDGIHQFMLQPGICDTFRLNAQAFAAVADWGDDSSPSSIQQQLAAAAAQATTTGAAAVIDTNKQAVSSAVSGQTSVSSAPRATVGLGVVFRNLLAQRKKGVEVISPGSSLDGAPLKPKGTVV